MDTTSSSSLPNSILQQQHTTPRPPYYPTPSASASIPMSTPISTPMVTPMQFGTSPNSTDIISSSSPPQPMSSIPLSTSTATTAPITSSPPMLRQQQQPHHQSPTALPLPEPLSPPQTKLDMVYTEEYGKKLQLVERVRHEIDLDDVKTPGIIVIGSQSAGKSSVLARLTGMPFPTGDNLCTRTPTVVHTTIDPTLPEHAFEADVSDDPAFVKRTVHCASPGQLRDAIATISKRLVAQTSTSTAVTMIASDGTNTQHDDDEDNSNTKGTDGANGSICRTPIYVRRVRRNGPVLTLIDLPGITHLDATNEGFDIHAATTGIVREYARDERLIMLVVIPATDDFANSEALRIAQEYDPQGKRTVGVISKCDLVPHSSDILDKMNMTRPSDVKLALGFIAVRNRARGDLSMTSASSATSLQQQQQQLQLQQQQQQQQQHYNMATDVDLAEDRLFVTHPLLRRLRPSQRGIRALTERIVNLQGVAVERFFASLRSQLWDAKNALKERLDRLPGVPSTIDERRDIFIDVLSAIHARVSLLVHTEDVSAPDLNIPSRTFEMCERFARDILNQMPNCLADEFVAEVRGMQAEGRGRLLPDANVDTVVGQQVRSILFGGPTARARGGVVQNATDDLVNKVMMFMVRCYETVIHEETERAGFPLLASVICAELGTFMQCARKNAAQVTGAILAAERSICFTQNSLYTHIMKEVRRVSGDASLAAAPEEDRRHIVRALVARILKNTGVVANGNVTDGQQQSQQQQRQERSGRASNTTTNNINSNPSTSGFFASLPSSTLSASGDLFRECSVLSVAADVFEQDNVTQEDYVLFLERFITEAAMQTETWSLMHAQFSVHCYLHVVIKRLCDVIPMVVRNVLVYDSHASFLPSVSKTMLRDVTVFEDAMRESARERGNRKAIEEKYTKLDDVLSKMLELGLEKSESSTERERGQREVEMNGSGTGGGGGAAA